MLRSLMKWGNELLYKPAQVFWICLVVAIVGVVLDGSALRLWSLHRDHRVLNDKILQAKSRSKQLQFQIQEAQQPHFIERVARDQFDLVKEGDLIFIFTEDNIDSVEKTDSAQM